MRCSRCQYDAPLDAAFCPHCGAQLTLVCAHCAAENAHSYKFCKKCGQLLVTPEKPAEAAAKTAAPSTPGAERRQLTVMFCDLVGSTALSEHLDPEELRDVLRDYQAVCAAVIRRFDGYIAQYLGDGLLVYFGYPEAHEDDAQRAVRAGLGIVEAVRGLNTRLREQAVTLAIRVGIHTGLVVIGELGGGDTRERLALGETPNIAARLEGLAEPDSVAISGTTARLVQGFFACLGLGTQSLKGVSQPMELFQVLRESAARSRLEVVGAGGLTPLVGREQEMGLLLERWEQVKDGLGQVVVLTGEAGIGKSRLVHALKEHVAKDPQAWLTPCQCSPYHQNSFLYPIIDLLERVVLRLDREDSPQRKLDKLEGFLVQRGFSLPKALPLFAALLSIPPPDNYAPLKLSPEQQKRETLHAWLTVWLKRAAEQPSLLVVEDLHWIDPSTLELLSLLVDQIPTARIMALFTCRPTFSLPWSGRSHLTHITLNRLTRKQVEVMVNRVARGKALPAEVLQQVVSKTDGVPLFVEELTKMVLESALLREQQDRYELMGPLPPLAIPATLQDSLMARLDRLATVREVAQLGATLGREFSYELLQAVSTVDEATLQSALNRLVEAELLYQRGLLPQATYLFKHALIQEAAYQSLLKSKRQHYHQRAVQVLRDRFPENVETQPELLAHHCTQAGLKREAIGYWLRAGQRAIQRSANVEAVGHLTQGLEVLRTLPETTEHAEQELALQTTLGPALIATKGHASPEVEQTFLRARELCQKVGGPSQLFRVLRGLWLVYNQRGELQTARELGEQCLSLAQNVQDTALILEAHRALGITLYNCGEVASARGHFEQGIALYDPQQHHSHAFLYGLDPGAVFRMFAAWTLWLMGYPDQAAKRIGEALSLARDLAHGLTLAQTLDFAAWLHVFRREGPAAREQAEAAIALSTEQRLPLWLAVGTILRGWALVEQGEWDKGIGEMREGLAAHRATGSETYRPFFLALLAELSGRGDNAEEGLSLLAEALSGVERTGERWWEPELYRLKGELLGQSAGADAEAATCFRQAVDLARRQLAKSLELRAAMSLCRLLQRQGKKEEARQTLGETYGWFTEGFNTADLKEAQALLGKLS